MTKQEDQTVTAQTIAVLPTYEDMHSHRQYAYLTKPIVDAKCICALTDAELDEFHE